MANDSLWSVLVRNILWILVFEFVFQGIFYVLGDKLFFLIYVAIGLIANIIKNVLLPIHFSKMVFRDIDHPVNKRWKVGAFLICWLPLIVLAPIHQYLYTHVSGYYKDYMQPWDVGAGETYAVMPLFIGVYWIATTTITNIYFRNYNRQFEKRIKQQYDCLER